MPHTPLATALAVLASAALLAACSSLSSGGTDKAAAETATYACESGATISASYPDTETATIVYQEREHKMRIAVSGSGARYVGDGLEWWTKGSGPGADGTLFEHLRDGTSGDALEHCQAS